MGFFRSLPIGIELQVGLELGDGFVFLLHLLCNLGEGVVRGGVVRLGLDGVLGAKIGAGKIVVVHVELCDLEVLVDALIVGLDAFDLGEPAVDGAAFGAWLRQVRVGNGGV
jgi:hypothetical protein